MRCVKSQIARWLPGTEVDAPIQSVNLFTQLPLSLDCCCPQGFETALLECAAPPHQPTPPDLAAGSDQGTNVNAASGGSGCPSVWSATTYEHYHSNILQYLRRTGCC